MNNPMKQFTEQDTENYYNASDKIYQSFWDKEGGLHWGYFEQDNKDDFKRASNKLTELMIEKSGINKLSKVLDVGCGNGAVTIEIAKKCLCKIDGIDLSEVRIQNAINKLNDLPQDIKELITFQKSSAINLPYEDKTFSHVWSQATIYHVHDKEKALKEVLRVLKSDGIFIFDDLLKPKENISDIAKKNVYERLLFDTPFSFESYQKYLTQIGFEVIEAIDLSSHLKKSYHALINILTDKIGKDNKFDDKYNDLISAYKETSKAIEKEELGWGLFLCKKSNK